MYTDSITNQKNIMVIGSTCVDIIINIDHLPKTEEDIHPSGQSLSLGGCAYNVASVIRLFKIPVTLVSPVGTGFYGEFVEKELVKREFDVKIHVPDMDNGCCYCLVEAGGERTFMSCHGAEYTFQKSWMTLYEEKNYDMVYICGLEVEEPTGMELIEYLEQHPERELFYAPGPRGLNIAKEKTDRIYALHPILHINESEALGLSCCASIEDAAKRLFKMTSNTVIITCGPRGAYCREKSGAAYMVDGFPANVVDTIGAGDSHIGAVMASLSMGYSLREAIETANRVSALVVGVKGAALTAADMRSVQMAKSKS